LKTLHVYLADRTYPIFVGEHILPKAGPILARTGFRCAPVVVTNNTVLKLHGNALLRSLQKTFGETEVICIGDGERFKNHASLMRIYDGLFRAHADRSSWVLAFGGGVIGDIAGFAAATFMRGIPYAMVPTTLLSQVDSSIGGKVGLNVKQGKNLVGAFHQPSAVLSDTAVLKTLSARELASGIYEVVKCGAIRSNALLRYVDRNTPAILQCNSAEMLHIVAAAGKIKADVVAADETESGLRMILNFGHTVGHAFEAATGYARFKHGEAVALGMIAVLGYGRELGLLHPGESASLIQLIRRIGKLPAIKGISIGKLWGALMRDKKFQAGDIRMIMLRQLGDAEIRSGINPASLRRFLEKFLAEGGN
jgi:3-dehydroquinate synthase